MMKLETAHIEEVRGIRKLDIDFRKEKFAISGPNGSGKSGVIDAIEFGLTGQIGRLTGRGVNAGEKMHQRAGVKLHHVWMPNVPTGGLWLRDKQDEKCVAAPANVPETSSVALTKRAPLPQLILRPSPSSLSDF